MATPSPRDDEARYTYGDRQVPDMSRKHLRPGIGRVSGHLGAWLGFLSLCAVLAWRFPEYLSTREFREIYDMELLRELLRGSLLTGLVFSAFSFLRFPEKKLGGIGLITAGLAMALGGWWLPTRAVDQVPFSLGLDYLAWDTLRAGVMFIFLEKMFPRYRDQAILRPGWKLDAFYFVLNHLLISAIFVVTNGFSEALFGWAVNDGVQGWVRGLPLGLQVLLLVVCADFVQYWVHRLFHEVPFLWRIHAVHHSTEHMDWLAGSRIHLIEVFAFRSVAMVPLYLLGADVQALNIYVLIAGFQAVFSHANVGVRLGWLRHLLVTPQFHHWHHSSDKPAIDTNYAVHLPIWDRLFGTFHMPDDFWPIDYGTVRPVPRTFLGQLWHPFRGEPASQPGEAGP